MSERALVQVEHLKKYFDAKNGRVLRAVDDVSFTIPKGTTLGMVGESGCGKTTVGRTILRLYEKDGGKVLFDGIDVHGVGKKEYKALTKRMQMIFQDPYASLDPRFTVGDIVAEGLDIHNLCASKADRRDRIHELLEMVGLNQEHASRFPHEFSGGQRQRVGIARALAVEPEFIVCDEAISALDVSIQAQVINLLIDLQRKKGLTYLFIAHDLSMVRHISDKTAVMYLGSMVELAGSDEVYERRYHPYTKALLSAIPVANPEIERKRERIILHGDVPSPVDLPPGCPFAVRCPYAKEACREEKPKLIELEKGHFVACHRAKEING